MSIHNNLRQLRAASGMTQEQAAQRLGVTRQALSSYETGRTRPDIDALMRLAHLYGTDLEGILYGQEPAQRTARCFKLTAVIFWVTLLILEFISSALLWCANFFFPLKEGALAQEGKALLDAHFRLAGAWECVDGFLLIFSFLGSLLLLIRLLKWKYKIPLRTGLICLALCCAVLFLLPLPFALTDPIFPAANYLFTPLFVTSRLCFFALLYLVIRFIQSRPGLKKAVDKGEKV